jgi:L-alanine-DL-glutamate epimerase-like enolase superfamily enzyme
VTAITDASVSVYTIPTDGPESDGTLEWTSTTIVIVEVRLLCDRAPAGMEIAAGEYGYDLYYFRRMLDAGAVDVLQADATRCGGLTGLLQVGALCDAYNMPLSAHTASALHLHPCCAIARTRHVEHFYDHERIERMLFDGVPEPLNGMLRPDLSRPGFGLEFKRADLPSLELRHGLAVMQ